MSALSPYPGDESVEVLVTVKTYPNPSDSYGETVCVAGVRIDGATPEWIRLYPVKFRSEEFDRQFKKYEIIRVAGTYRKVSDNRPESFKPRQDQLTHIDVVDTGRKWRRRKQLLGDLVGARTMCELVRANPPGGMATPSESLGLIKPVDVETSVVAGDPWTPTERAKIEKASAPDLFGSSLRPLEPAPFAVRYKYRCETKTCRGHDQKVLDWEAGQAGRRWIAEHGSARAREMMLDNWQAMMLSADRDVHFYVGNQARRRQSFSVLGVWYPPVEDTLF